MQKMSRFQEITDIKDIDSAELAENENAKFELLVVRRYTESMQ